MDELCKLMRGDGLSRTLRGSGWWRVVVGGGPGVWDLWLRKDCLDAPLMQPHGQGAGKRGKCGRGRPDMAPESTGAARGSPLEGHTEGSTEDQHSGHGQRTSVACVVEFT